MSRISAALDSSDYEGEDGSVGDIMRVHLKILPFDGLPMPEEGSWRNDGRHRRSTTSFLAQNTTNPCLLTLLR
jgi:hypothetical protein